MAAGMEGSAGLTTSKPEFLGIVMQAHRAALIADGATMYLSYKHLKGVPEGQQMVICSRDRIGKVNVLKLHAVVCFRGNQFVTRSALDSERYADIHGMNTQEYQAMRSQWPAKHRQRDGAVAWQFDVVNVLGSFWAPDPTAESAGASTEDQAGLS